MDFSVNLRGYRLEGLSEWHKVRRRIRVSTKSHGELSGLRSLLYNPLAWNGGIIMPREMVSTNGNDASWFSSSPSHSALKDTDSNSTKHYFRVPEEGHILILSLKKHLSWRYSEWNKFHFVSLQNLHYFRCFWYFYFIIIFLFLFLPFSFFSLVCLLDFIVSLIFFILLFILHSNFSSFTSFVLQ